MGSLRSWCPTPSRRSTSRAASGTCSPGPSRSYVATAARSPSPSGGSGKADGKTDAEGAPTGQELLAELILAYLASGCRVNRTQAAAALSELISVGLLTCRDGRYSLCRRRQRPRALLLRTDAEVLRTAASPTPASPTGSTRPTSVPFWRRPTSCKPATKARYRTLEKYT